MFKKIFFGMSALALFAACTGDYTDWAQPQTNAGVPAKTIEWSVAAAQQATIDLNAVESETVKLFNVNLPAGVTAESFKVKLADTGNNTVAAKYNEWGVTADADGYVTLEDLQNATTGMFGKDAVERTFNATVTTSVVVEGETSTVAIDLAAEPFVLTIIPVAPEFAEYIYEIGNDSGWGTPHALYCANSDGKYQGYYYLNGGYKFKPNKDDWNGDWGQDPNEAEGKLTEDGEKDCNAAEGFYQIDVDLVAMTYSTTLVSSISIIGTVNGSWDTDTDLTYNTETGAWEVTTDLNAGAMKFRMNHDWAISWGGANGDPKAYDNLTQNGGKDLDVTEAGKYFIQLFITYEGNNKVVITKK